VERLDVLRQEDKIFTLERVLGVLSVITLERLPLRTLSGRMILIIFAFGVQVRAILMVMRATECVSVPVWDANAGTQAERAAGERSPVVIC
jgi:hypothetical protein